jgi:hypothetical protein
MANLYTLAGIGVLWCAAAVVTWWLLRLLFPAPSDLRGPPEIRYTDGDLLLEMLLIWPPMLAFLALAVPIVLITKLLRWRRVVRPPPAKATYRRP